MHILVLNWKDIKNPTSGGAEIVTHEHAKAWVKAGHTVTWFTSDFPNASKMEVVDGIHIVRKGNYYTVYLFAPFFYFFSGNIFDLVIDEIHGIPFFTPLYVMKPKIAFIHEVAGEIWDYMYPFPLNILGKLFEHVYFLFYRRILFWTDAESTRAELVTYGIKKDNSLAIACPATNKPLTNIPEKEKFPTYIFVSRLVKMKGVEDVIKAFSHIYSMHNNARLWIVGDGEEKYVNQLKEVARLLDLNKHIIFFGKVTEDKKLHLLKKAHILLHASVKEGWGLVVIEAASQATPAVVYNVNGLKDTVKNNVTGVVVSQNTPESLAKHAVALLKDGGKYTKYQKNCISWASSLQWSKATLKSLQLLSNV